MVQLVVIQRSLMVQNVKGTFYPEIYLVRLAIKFVINVGGLVTIG